MSFDDKVIINLTLMVGRDQYTVEPGNVQMVKAEMTPLGFTASVGFWCRAEGTENSIFTDMLDRMRCDVRLTIESIINVPDEKPEPLLIRGPVTRKTIEERFFNDITETPVLFRYFELEFADTASVLWKEHFPSELLSDATMSDMFKTHCMEGVDLRMAWPLLEVTKPIIAVHLPPDNGASFYDFVLWYTDTRSGSLTYDNQANAYYLTDIKVPGADPIQLPYRYIDRLRILQTRIPRHEVNLLNSYSADSQKSEVEQDYAVSGVRRDYVVRTQVASEYDARKKLEKERLKQPDNHVEIEFSTFPWVSYGPGFILEMKEADWPEQSQVYGQNMRVINLSLNCEAHSKEPDVNRDHISTPCHMSLSVILENQLDLMPFIPDYRAPVYPLIAEGKVLSDTGEENETTFNIYRDDDTSLDGYKINIPLWNKDVPVLFEADYLPPHFFFPAYRDARVLMAFDFDTAEIRRFLDFGPRVQMPMDSQGNHLLMGFNEQSQTSISHQYVNNKPILDIERTTEGQTELIRFSDGTILIQTESDESGLSSGGGMDLTAFVEAGVADVTIKSQAGLADATAVFDNAKDGIKDDINGAKTDAEEALDSMDEVLGDKMGAVGAIVDGAMSKVAESADALKASFADAKAELMNQLKL